MIGGTGYIGSRLFFHLGERFKITTVDLEWFGNYVNRDNIRKDYRDLNKVFLEKFDAIILLAGHSSVAMCQSAMLDSFKNNVENFVYLLSKIRPGQKFIYASSSSVYTNSQDKKSEETDVLFEPLSHYDLSKQEIDHYAKLSDVEFYGLRFGTVNGASPNLRTDIMLNKMYESIVSGSIKVFNRKICRPILGIRDLCFAIEKIITSPDRRGIYNLASFNSTIENIVDELCRIYPRIVVKDQGSTDLVYNFSIQTRKFCNTFDFHFQDTIESIITELALQWDKMSKSIRIKRKYV